MHGRFIRTTLCVALGLWIAGVPVNVSGAADDSVARDAAALRELLEGDNGRRDAWGATPGLIVLSTIMEFSTTDMLDGYVATKAELTQPEILALTTELTSALGILTGGTVSEFADIRVERVPAGLTAHVFRPGYIVVGRYRDVRTKTGTLGYGGRMTRRGAITAAAVVLDHEFDRKGDHRRLLRTHELGHALGFNHVESRPSVMNRIVGSDVTDFDRNAIRMAFGPPPEVTTSRLPAWDFVLPIGANY